MRLTPDHVEETLAVVKLPNYEEKYNVSALSFDSMKRYQGEVNLEPILQPVHHKDTIIVFSNCTKKRFVSHTYYEPKVKPRYFSETLVIFPKRPCKLYKACLDYHIDECRKWFRTSMEFTAKTFTTHRIKKRNAEKQSSETVVNGNKCVSDPNGPGASQIYLPRYNRDKTTFGEDDIVMTNNLVNGELNDDIKLNGSDEGFMNDHVINGDVLNGDILIPGIQSHRWV